MALEAWNDVIFSSLFDVAPTNENRICTHWDLSFDTIRRLNRGLPPLPRPELLLAHLNAANTIYMEYALNADHTGIRVIRHHTPPPSPKHDDGET
jgi:hypothetical protein